MHLFDLAYPLDLTMTDQLVYLKAVQVELIVDVAEMLEAGCLESENIVKNRNYKKCINQSLQNQNFIKKEQNTPLEAAAPFQALSVPGEI